MERLFIRTGFAAWRSNVNSFFVISTKFRRFPRNARRNLVLAKPAANVEWIKFLGCERQKSDNKDINN